MTINFAAGTFAATDGFDLNLDIDGLGNENDAGEFGDMGVTATITFEDGRTQEVTFANTDGDTSVASFSLQPPGGSDMLLGGAGNDTLIGSFGNDIAAGGAGADIFKYVEFGAANVDRVVDYSFMEGDKLNLDDFAWDIGGGETVDEFVRLLETPGDSTSLTVQINLDGDGADWEDVAILSGYRQTSADIVKIVFDGAAEHNITL
jgi:hypothetical protein